MVNQGIKKRARSANKAFVQLYCETFPNREGEKGIAPPFPQNKGRKIQSSRLNRGRDKRFIAQSFQFFETGFNFAFSIELVVILRPQILERDAFFQHMVNGDQHGMGNRDISAFFTPMGADSLKLRTEIGAFDLDRRLCAHNKSRTQ